MRLGPGHGRVSDRHSQFDCAADGAGEQVGGSVQIGTRGCEVLE